MFLKKFCICLFLLVGGQFSGVKPVNSTSNADMAMVGIKFSEIACNYFKNSFFMKKRSEYIAEQIKNDHTLLNKVLNRTVEDELLDETMLRKYIEEKHTFVSNDIFLKKECKTVVSLLLLDIGKKFAFKKVKDLALGEETVTRVCDDSIGTGKTDEFYNFMNGLNIQRNRTKTSEFAYDTNKNFESVLMLAELYFLIRSEGLWFITRFIKTFLLSIPLGLLVVFGKPGIKLGWSMIKAICFLKGLDNYCRYIWTGYVLERREELKNILNGYSQAVEGGEEEAIEAYSEKILDFVKDSHKEVPALRKLLR